MHPIRRAALAIAALGTFGAASTARAQLIGLGVGTLVPQGDSKSTSSAGRAVIGSIELGDQVAFRAEGLWANSDLRGVIIHSANGVPVPSDANVSGSVKTIGAIGSLVIHLASGPIQPYILGGAGYYSRSVAQDAHDAVSDFGHASLNDSKVGWHAGLGLKLTMGMLSAFGEVRYHSVNTDGGKTNFIPLLVGIRLL